jgi:hypothetical protein
VSEDVAQDEIQCSNASFEHSAAEHDLGGTNVVLGDMTTAWFMEYGTGDFHLTPIGNMVFAGIALWTTGDPTTDIDGQDRPDTPDSSDYAGADRIPR